MRPVLFYTVGYPGAGKTTLASGLASLLASEHLRGDKIGLQLFRFPTYSPEERRIVYSEMNKRAATHMRACRHAIYDAATNTVALRQALQELARQHGGVAIGLRVDVPTDLAKKRAGKARDAGLAGGVVRVIPPHIFDQYVAAFEMPTTGEVVLTISGNAPFYLQYRRLQRQLRPYGIHLPRLVQ
jgi:predicted kinase